MTLSIVRTRAGLGLEAPEVLVEVHLANGLPGITLVGLPETAVRESRERVRSALVNAGFDFPLRRITLNLAPADLPKEGGRFDLPIALGILVASGQIPAAALAETECAGELALDGALRPVAGVLPLALATRRAGRRLIVPRANADEAALAGGLEVLPADHLLEVVAHLLGQAPIAPHRASRPAEAPLAGPTSPRCGASIRPGGPWRSPPAAATTCCWPARPAPARPCWPVACPASCRR